MYYTVYIDVLFLVNFLMDFFILWLMKSVLQYRGTYLKLFFSAVIGALWLCFIVAFPVLPKLIEYILTYIVVSGGMIYVAFQKKTIRELLWGMVYLYLFAVFLGGVCNVFYYHTRIGTINQWFLMASFSGLVCYLVLREVYRDKKNIFTTYDVVLYYKEKQLMVKGLLDSGNSLLEPVSKKPVNIVDFNTIKDFIVTIEGCRYIPYQSVGKENGLLVGVEIDRMEIERGETRIRIERPVIGICDHSLSENRRFQILLHPSLFDGYEREGECLPTKN